MNEVAGNPAEEQEDQPPGTPGRSRHRGSSPRGSRGIQPHRRAPP